MKGFVGAMAPWLPQDWYHYQMLLAHSEYDAHSYADHSGHGGGKGGYGKLMKGKGKGGGGKGGKGKAPDKGKPKDKGKGGKLFLGKSDVVSKSLSEVETVVGEEQTPTPASPSLTSERVSYRKLKKMDLSRKPPLR